MGQEGANTWALSQEPCTWSFFFLFLILSFGRRGTTVFGPDAVRLRSGKTASVSSRQHRKWVEGVSAASDLVGVWATRKEENSERHKRGFKLRWHESVYAHVCVSEVLKTHNFNIQHRSSLAASQETSWLPIRTRTQPPNSVANQRPEHKSKNDAFPQITSQRVRCNSTTWGFKLCIT